MGREITNFYNKKWNISSEKLFYQDILHAFENSKTPHLFQIAIRKECRKFYDKHNALSAEDVKERIRGLLSKAVVELNNQSNPKEEFLMVLERAAAEFMKGDYPPNVEEYDDQLQSVASKTIVEKGVSSTEAYNEAYVLTRGIGYKVSSFDQFSRTQHRSYSEGGTRPNYSIAAIKRAMEHYNAQGSEKLILGDYFKGLYDRNITFIRFIEDACKEIANDFKFLRNPRYKLPVKFEGELKEIEPIYLLQDIYTNDMAIFKLLINKEKRKNLLDNYQKYGHPLGKEGVLEYELNRNGVLAKENPGALFALINLLEGDETHLDFEDDSSSESEGAEEILLSLETAHLIHYEDNPFTSTGYTSRAAFDYSMENKTYGVYHLQEFYPNYNKELIPQHPFVGKFYSFILPKSDYDDYVANSAMNVVKEHEEDKILIHESIIDENEMTFIGGCVFSTEPKQKVASYPELSKTWHALNDMQKSQMRRRYGLDELSYSKLRQGLSTLITKGIDPPYLREEFINSFIELLNNKKNKKTDSSTDLWARKDVVDFFKTNPLNVATIRSFSGENSTETLACIEKFNAYNNSKKAFHFLFKDVYEHMLQQFEQEAIDYALGNGFKLLNLSESGLNYQEEKVSQEPLDESSMSPRGRH